MVTMAVGRPVSNNLRNSTLHARLRYLAYGLLYRGGAVARARRRSRQYAKILLYHSVAPVESDFTRGIDVTIHPETIARQLDYLMQYYHVVPLQELVKRLQAGRPVGGCVVITFDDGFADNYEWAWPLLRQRGLPVTIFVTADAIDNAALLWVHRLNWLLNKYGWARVLTMAEHMIDRPDISVAQRGSLGLFWDYMICRLTRTECEAFLASLFGALDVAPIPYPGDAKLYLSSAQIQSLNRDGVDFGCHGKTHTAFSVLSDSELTTELNDSLKRLLPLLSGNTFPALAYPFGETRHFTSEVQSRAQEIGHRVILTATGAQVEPRSPPISLSRVQVVEESTAEFAARIEGASIRAARPLFKVRNQ